MHYFARYSEKSFFRKPSYFDDKFFDWHFDLIFVRFVSCFIVGVFRYNRNIFMDACFANGLNITQFPWAIQLSSFVKLEIGRKYPFFAKAQKHSLGICKYIKGQ